MRIATIIMIVVMGTLMPLPMDAVAKDKVYRWVDDNGVVHFGDRPDQQTNAELVNIHKSPAASSEPPSPSMPTDADQQQEPQPSYAQQRRDERTKKRKENAETQQAIAAQCEKGHQLVAKLEPVTKVMLEQEDGTVIRMDDNDRLDKLNEAKAYIAANCDK